MKIDTARLSEEVDIEDVALSLGLNPHRKGSNIFITCPNPEHTEKLHDNCSINKNKKKYRCFACGDSGDSIRMVQQVTGCSFAEAATQAASSCGGIERFCANNQASGKPFLSNEELNYIGLKRFVTVKEILSLSFGEDESHKERVEDADDGFYYGQIRKTKIDCVNDEMFPFIALSKLDEKIVKIQGILSSVNDANDREKLLDSLAYAMELKQKVKKIKTKPA